MKRILITFLFSLSLADNVEAEQNALPLIFSGRQISSVNSSQNYDPDCNCSISPKNQFHQLEQVTKKLPSTPAATDWDTFKNSYGQRSDINGFLNALSVGAGQKIGPGGKIYKGRKPKNRFTKLCYRYVKAALLKSGLSSKYLGGSKAYQAKTHLEKQGFINILKDPSVKSKINSYRDFPTGTILVYSGGNAGHIEVKTNTGFVSDFINDKPVTGSLDKYCRRCKNSFSGRNRKLIGAYVLGEAFNKVNINYASTK
jgi:hypothetical protein